ncbi:uncharacterized protein isoform X2 [Leptinotarsa decemlineata]|uniref:uncharacterized protein isoform X2 n=1 Tax=Leptinotarsa decemlineata TaxID=7539 RepID=UPI003D306B85
MGSTFLFYENILCNMLHKKSQSSDKNDLKKTLADWNPTDEPNVLAATDLILSINFFFNGLSKCVTFFTVWYSYGLIIGLPVSAAINALNVMATVAVTVDRVIYMWNPLRCSRPKFCSTNIARGLMMACLILSIVLNLPYCFIFDWNEFGDLTPSSFYLSWSYALFNWFMLAFLSIIPGIFLILGNGFLIRMLHTSRKISVKCNRKKRNSTHVTLVLIAIVICFLLSEIPSSIVSKAKAADILFYGRKDMTDSENFQIIREVCTLLGAINVGVSFLLYCLFCPPLYRALIKTLRNKKQKTQSIQVNVFVLTENEKKFQNIKTEFYDISKGVGMRTGLSLWLSK